MSRIWIISDTHFGHNAMLTLCGRPANFTELEITNLSKLPKEDILIHLGDICIGSDSTWHNILETSVVCKKILVKGNHDNKSNSWYLTHGWDFVCETFSIKHMGYRIIFSHMPQPLANNNINIHGHYHNCLNKLKQRSWEEENKDYFNRHSLINLTKNHINISVEETNYKPILLETVIKQFKKQEQGRIKSDYCPSHVDGKHYFVDCDEWPETCICGKQRN